jgi:exopolysaccharide biosynthesis polyprenyl glycosylphosphotransferase
MIEKKHQTLAATYLAIDLIACMAALVAGWSLRFQVQILPVTKGVQDLEVYLRLLPLVLLIFPLAFSIQGLYRIRPSRGRAEELIAVAVATVFGIVVLSGLLLWVRPPQAEVEYSRLTLAMFALCLVVFVSLGRSLVRVVVERRHRRGLDLDRVLIAGSGALARTVAERLKGHRELGFELVGFIGEEGEGVDTLARLGSLDDAEQLIERHRIDHVFVALPQTSSTETMELLDRLVRQYVTVHVVPDLMQFLTLRARVEEIEGLPTINLSESPLAGWSGVIKRGFDFAAALTALILLSPLFALIALLIWLEDRGPIFYRQTRMGLDAIPFEILKFRSMRVGAEKATGVVWAERDDPRRTRIGRWLRAWSLDELPQLWNVVRGEMSLVGPRPERPHFVQQFRSEYPHYMLRHKVRAGMTGWAQVHGWRGNTSLKMRIEHDLYYIENWSIGLDLKILLMTVRHGIRHENAY